jgi:hypothetical protein
MMADIEPNRAMPTSMRTAAMTRAIPRMEMLF